MTVQPLLDVRNLTVSLPAGGGRQHEIVRDISFNILPGEAYGLVGESGSGKSVTSLAVIPFCPGHIAGICTSISSEPFGESVNSSSM